MHKPVFLTGWLRKSYLLTANEFERIRADAEVLEQDAYGIKVLRLANGDILKLFRVKHVISSARLYSHARSFCRNADRLKSMGIPTMTIAQLLTVQHTSNSAVLYQPLPGHTLREIARSEGLNVLLLQQLGIFVANLHRHGILFRSLHFGNIVRTNTGKFGLIDVADLSIRPWGLFCAERLRNFRHLCRLEEDRKWMGYEGWKTFSVAYAAAASLDKYCLHKIELTAEQWFGPAKHGKINQELK